MAKPKNEWWKILIRFKPDTEARILAVKDKSQDKTDFIREAVDRELRRRERSTPSRATKQENSE